MNSKTARMTITLTPRAFWHLQWMCQRTQSEVSSMGLLSPAREGFLIEDFILVKQAVTAASVDLDMAWWAEKQIELYERRAIEPWRTSCWCHTHPAGVNGPSATDERTMAQSFGQWDFALMLILTKGGVFYARMDFDHEFPEGGKKRFNALCSLQVDWGASGSEAVTEETLKAWETEFQELVRECGGSWLSQWPGEDELTDGTAGVGRKRPALKTKPGDQLKPPEAAQEMEADEYARICESIGVDPNDPALFEEYFGYAPDPVF